MKRILLATTAACLLATGPAFADDHSTMHEMMIKEDTHREDTRVEIKIPEQMKVMHKAIMRSHLDTLSKVTDALAADNMTMAAQIARENLGWNESQEKMCSRFGKSAGKEFMDLGKAMHSKADELADAAGAGDRDKAFAILAVLMKNCNACHEKFRH
ncbi:MAG: hypothetical protein A3J24_01070 [Deltaproteobacteria bacterium RIFCSPLOWO2_02_FULL_53_8]|nr:MAG: hypothetical protein A3J24_01070 [Deltaproteobacteria bacterium RIFCSPLOWO2_02_FULL_53_8]